MEPCENLWDCFQERHLRVGKKMALPAWNEDFQRRAIGYWEGRRFRFEKSSGGVLEGTRGSIWGNLFSFDMSKLRTRLVIRETTQNVIESVLDIDIQFQVVTDYNMLYWMLELETFETALLEGDYQEGRWDRFRKADRRAAWSWLMSPWRAGP